MVSSQARHLIKAGERPAALHNHIYGGDQFENDQGDPGGEGSPLLHQEVRP